MKNDGQSIKHLNAKNIITRILIFRQTCYKYFFTSLLYFFKHNKWLSLMNIDLYKLICSFKNIIQNEIKDLIHYH